MKIIKDEEDILNSVKKKAYSLSENNIIVFRPDKSKIFLSNIKERILQTQKIYKKLTNQVKLYKHLTHEVENLFDNYYIVDSAISDILNTKIDKGFKKIVQIEKTPGVFIPRIYLILNELLKTSDYKINRSVLYSFLQAYQLKANLSIRELSFVPFFLRIIFIENIEKLMHRSMVALEEFKDSEYWFKQITKNRENSKEQTYSKLTSALAVKYGVIPVNLGFNLLQKLSQYGPDTRPFVKWLKLNLLKQGIKISDLAEIENKRQDDISTQIFNTINSLRWTNQVRWDDFVVEINVVDSFLEKDPSGFYLKLDQASQTAYRNEVVKISDQIGVYESEVVKLALRLCSSVSLTKTTNLAENHIGYYLVGKGRDEFEKKIGYQKSFKERIQSVILSKSSLFYLGSIFLINVLLTYFLASLFLNIIGQSSLSFILIGLLFILNCDVVVNLVNIFVSSFIPVRTLFRLDLTNILSREQATFVVIPSMFRDAKSAKELLHRLEVNFLGNCSDNIYFALLMDFKDSKTEITNFDDELVSQINLGIEELNQKYSSITKRFYLFHRHRIWNPQEKVFMGWERKRGKIREFNLFLRNKRPTSYLEKLPVDLPAFKYVLTIDEDTRLPKDSALKLIGCIDHPLNRPVIDWSLGKVISGYGIIQPRMTTKFSQARATIFSRLFSSSMGIDSYTGPAADVYQDLFNNSIFYGKGIYDIDAMEATIGDRIPENQVLSHDLLEGLYTRVGFATDIFLFEGFPESYKEYILRMHRWIRGDWQISGWLKFSLAKNNNFSLSDKWKIFDNLRRSMLPTFGVLLLLFSAIFYNNYYSLFLIYSLFIVGSSFVISYLFRLFEWPKEMTLYTKINTIFDNLDDLFFQISCRFIFLLDQAIISLRAVTVSLFRTIFSKKYLLRWQNSHEVAKGLRGTFREFAYLMWPTLVISSVYFIFSFKFYHNWYVDFTFLLWFISPLLAFYISHKEKKYQYKQKDLVFLRKIACRSSRFFLELSNRDGNHLIPDHYQEEPVTNSPAATSPTNIGMHLLSEFSAYDFGYISFSNLLKRIYKTFETLNNLERYRGHFYNWYDIRTLQSLAPKYVSSVDSANFLVNLLTLKQGILDISQKPIFNEGSLSGLVDVLTILLEDIKLIINDKAICKSEKRIARHIYNEVKPALKKISFNRFLVPASIEYLTKIFNDLAEINEKIKKIVSNLNLGLNKGILASIYSSAEHLNILLEQQTEELNTFMSFYNYRRTRPVIRDIKKNNLLAKILDDIYFKLDTIPSLAYLGNDLKNEIEDFNLLDNLHLSDLAGGEKENIERWYYQIMVNIDSVQTLAKKSLAKYDYVISLCDKFFNETDFSFLYNKERGLFHIGYNVTFEKIDSSYYDFLASEANSISFLAIIKNQVSLKHWFYLGRKLVRLDTKNVLLSSWGGSLFEYLTSLIFFNVHQESLLGHTAKLAIEGHIKYGQENNVPWGMGESAYSAVDLNNNYQYQIFGHPALGFKRDLKDFLVVAPYTTIMSLAFKPKQALINLQKLIKSKLLGRYGFYDAVDYSADYKNKKINKIALPVKIYYAHHQGFSIQALNNQVNNNRIYKLFSADPMVESADTLFEEKIPSSIPARPIKSIEYLQTEYLATGKNDLEIKQFIPVSSSFPRKAFLSNGSYLVNISNIGSGASKVKDLNLTRFREDVVNENSGQFIYLYDINRDYLWSPTTQPIGVLTGKNKIEYFENKARFNKIVNDIESNLTISLAPDNDVEFRSLTLTNHGKNKKSLKITSYGEVALSNFNDDLHHPSFEKLFVRSEYWSKYNSLIYIKPNKNQRGKNLYFAHKLVIPSANKIEVNYTTDRSQFINRGGSLREPNFSLATNNKDRKNCLGYNFDPIFSFDNKIELAENETITLIYVNVFAESKEELVRNLKKYSVQKNINQAVKKSDKQGQEVMGNLGISSEQALNYQTLASKLLSPHYSTEIKSLKIDFREPLVQSLWRLGISGNLPILIVRFYDMNDLAMIKNILLCHKYLKYKGVAHDLVLLNEYPSSYIKSFEDEVDFLVRYNQSAFDNKIKGTVFHLRSSHMIETDKENLISLSKVLLDSKKGMIEQQIVSLAQSISKMPNQILLTTKKITSPGKDIFVNLDHTKFFNGLGGFLEEKREYVLNINYEKLLISPVPWVNIISNRDIGSIITESGSMYTWLYNSYDNRLTKRIDDPLVDRSSEVFYLRDEESGDFWCPTPLPIKNSHTYTIRHGLGYTKFEHKSRGIEQTMTVFVPPTDKVKIVRFKFVNTSKLDKKLSLTGFFEMALGGANRESTKDYLATMIDKETGAVIVKNIYTESFKEAFAFVDLNNGKSIFTNDREEFLGKNGEITNPAVMRSDKLSNILHDDVDHCVALETFFDLRAGQEIEITALLGGSSIREEIPVLIKKYREFSTLDISLAEIENNWAECLNKIQIKTPDESLDTLFNSRLLYQLITSRLVARTGYYQPSGAYGFRDQLQDSLALIWGNPQLTREIIIKAMHHQFVEGDAMNWWHEHNSFGVRSVFSDHQLWLPYVVSNYIEITNDSDILTEKAPYLKAPLLDFINNSTWAGIPEITLENTDLYDHCLRAIEKTFVFGKNGLPIIGKGDWNDGLNKVGEKGLGESVWLGWFLLSVISKFIPQIRNRGDTELIKRYEITAKNLKNSLEHNAWDGRWYKRAFFDSGTPLGSRSNREFKIDSISQSWSVLSGAGRPERCKMAMNSVTKNLFQDNNLLLLISPAVKDSQIDPGYIRDYPAGVRENGAQYNHAALWAAQAFAKLKDPVSVMKILDSVNPIKRSMDKDKVSVYRVEPYVVASDIYAKPAEAGRGGWTWYTGSAGVMYRTILESLLGLKIMGDKMEINPCIPKEWTNFSIIYTYKNTKYNIQVLNSAGARLGLSAKIESNKLIKLDGMTLSGNIINLLDDNKVHEVEVML
jgi:cyclic beta-1,2-glucan synthetase